MCDLVAEVHVPLVADPAVSSGEYAYPWLLELDEYFDDMDERAGEVFDDSEELDDENDYFLTGQAESVLLQTASGR